jgi:hypothetical protein
MLVYNGIYFVVLSFFKNKEVGVFILALTTNTVSVRCIGCETVSASLNRRRSS